MTATGRPDDTEVLSRHIPFLDGKMECLNVLLAPSSELNRLLETSDGKNWVRFVESYFTAVAAQKSLPNNPRSQFLANAHKNTKIIEALSLIKYIYRWTFLTQHQLPLVVNNLADFDIRWNQSITIQVCKLFVQFCKVIHYIKYNYNIRYFLLILFFSKEPEFDFLRPDISPIIAFLLGVQKNPFEHIRNSFSALSIKLTRFSLKIGTFLAKLFGSLPLYEWDAYSIFHKESSQPESTLPNDEFIILSNISLFKDTIFYYILTFPEASKNKECFSFIIKTVLSEAPVIYFSPTFKVPLGVFLKDVGSVFDQNVLNEIETIAKNKLSASHAQRMLRVTFLLKDIYHMCQFSTSLLPSLFNNIISLCSLAFYEINCYFMYSTPLNEAMDLLTVLLDIVKLIINNSQDIKRFFVFNLATCDAQFLEKQLTPLIAYSSSSDKDNSLPYLIQDLLVPLLSLDLEHFDHGVRYDFSGWLITHNRYLASFAKSKMRDRLSFIDPIFEHLSTIRFHMGLAVDPVESFFQHVPLYSLWVHISSFLSHVKDTSISINNIPSLLDLFNYFNFDEYVLRQLPSEIRSTIDKFNEIRGSLFIRITSSICEMLDKSSPHVKIGEQSHSFVSETSDASLLFSPKDFATTHRGLSKGLAVSQIKSTTSVVQMKEMFSRIPQTIIHPRFPGNPNQDIDKTASYFAKYITDNLAKYLFPNGIPNPSYIDMSFAAASQFLWPLFSGLGHSYPRRHFECRLVESSQSSALTYQDQLNLLSGASTMDGTINMQRIVAKFEDKIMNFISNDYKGTLYLVPLKGFWSSHSSVNDVSEFFSARGFRYLIQNLGIHCGARIDAMLTQRATSAMKTVYEKYLATKHQLVQWKNFIESKNDLPLESSSIGRLDDAGNEMIVLGVCLTLRSLLLNEIKDFSEQCAHGIKGFIDAAFKKEMNVEAISPESLLKELFCGDPSYQPFIRSRLLRFNIEKDDDLHLFFLFLSLILFSHQWDQSKYIPLYQAITNNLHLFPVAASAMIQHIDIFFKRLENDKDSKIKEGMGLFYNVLAQVVAQKRQFISDDLARALTIIADLFTRNCRDIEYGRLSESFPNRTINFAYSK